jgi:hypothetical protein
MRSLSYQRKVGYCFFSEHLVIAVITLFIMAYLFRLDSSSPNITFHCGKSVQYASPVQTWQVSSLATRHSLSLTTEFILNNTYKFCSYLTGNTLRLRYKDQPVKDA